MIRIFACLLLTTAALDAAPAGASAGAFAWAGQPGADGWIDLLAQPADWARESPSVAKFPLAARSPWRFERDRLHCAATGVYEMLYHRAVLGDGVLHVEWRYLPVEGAEEKNDSGVMFRTSPDRKLKLQVQLAGRGLGRIAGDQLRGTGRVHVGVGERRPELAAPIGAWNILELTLRGREARLVINGAETAVIPDLDSPPGQVGLQAEYWPVEFRRVLFRPNPEANPTKP